MNFETARNFLAQKGIEATDEQIAQAIAPMNIEDISENDVDFLVESLAEKMSIIPAPSKQKSAIAKSTNAGGKVAKGKGRKKAQIQSVSQEEELEVRTTTEANLSGAVGRAIAEVEQVAQAVEQGADLATVSYGSRIYTALNNIGPDSINGAVAALMATEDRTAFFRSTVESIFADSISAFEAE